MASDLYVKACDSGRSLFQQVDNLSSHIASKSKITAFREQHLLDSALVRSNVQDSVHFALTGAGISASNLRYVEVSSKKGRRKGKETAYINYMDGHNGVVLTTGMFKINDQNSPDKKLWASEVIWQSWRYIDKIEGRAASYLRVVGQYFVTNEGTKQIIRSP
ncbi:hypothetical protein JMJ35_008901 [Cladonia borealis]|uniref:Uncharacterized protein n=1 Tax=Cladonia borealis TaxID=184061 RepID=A0AA39QV43_9LECA|nr:hypothetical protein JMJ35_008901 [Cladonia borealis]